MNRNRRSIRDVPDRITDIIAMRTDEQIEAALEDANDLRPLLLAANDRELRPLFDAAGLDRNADADQLAEAIDRMIAEELGGGGHGGLQLRLSAWAARLLGAGAEPMDLATADREILRHTDIPVVIQP